MQKVNSQLFWTYPQLTLRKMYFVRCPRQLHVWHGETTIHIGRTREFVNFMTGQESQSVPRLSIVQSWRRLRIPCGLEYTGEPFPVQGLSEL